MGLFRLIQLVAGLSTSGPILYYTMIAAQQGEWLTFGVLVVVALFAFMLPGWLLERYIKWFLGLKQRCISYIVSKLKRLSPTNLR